MFLLLDLSVASIVFSHNQRSKKDLTKELEACFYGNTEFSWAFEGLKVITEHPTNPKSKVL